MTAFINGRFIPCDGGGEFTTLVEKKGRIVFTGHGVPPHLTGEEVVDLKGKCAVPSFGDTHIHFQSFAHVLANLDVRHAASLVSMAEMVKAHEGKKGGKPIIAFGCSAHTLEEGRLPTRDDLDEMCASPLFMVKYDGHAGVANSAMLERFSAKVLEADGFEKESGWFFQDSFYKATDAISRSISPLELLRNIEAAGNYLGRRGFSMVHAVEGMGYPLNLDVDLMRFTGRGLRQSVTTFFQTMAPGKARLRRMKTVGGCFANALDGCFGSEDAALLEPYAHDAANKGHLFYSQEEVDAFVKKAHGMGLQVALHGIGDAAVTQALNAFEKALADKPREDHRHVLIHGCLIKPEDIRRMADLGVCLAAQAPFLYWDLEPQAYLDGILGDRSLSLMPFRDLVDAGVCVAGGSDAPTTEPDALFAIWSACNHPNPAQSLTPMEALEMHTIRCAEFGREEMDRGSLSAGKRADFVVLDRHILETPKEAIREIQVEEHYLEGGLFEGKKRGLGRFLKDSLMKS